jgi:hypothetical protein
MLYDLAVGNAEDVDKLHGDTLPLRGDNAPEALRFLVASRIP